MLLYHGTSLSRWEKIKENGLLPRKNGSESNWTHTVESNADTVYLTDAYAMYFSLQCIQKVDKNFDHAVIIEVNTSKLDSKKLVADEDALEQASRNTPGGDGLPRNMTMEDRTRYYRNLTKQYASHGYDHNWSLKILGTCGYMGKIPVKAITRIAIVDLSVQKQMSVFLDPSISLMNYKFIGAKYRILNAMVFGDSPKPEDLEFLNMMGMGREVEAFNRNGIVIEDFSYAPKVKKIKI